jgi:hypothetical protein
VAALAVTGVAAFTATTALPDTPPGGGVTGAPASPPAAGGAFEPAPPVLPHVEPALGAAYTLCRGCRNVFEAAASADLPPCPLCGGVLELTSADQTALV